MRYGWKVNRPKLLEYAARHNVIYQYELAKCPRLADDVAHDGFEDRQEPDSSDDDDDDDEGQSYDEAMILTQAVWHIVNGLNLPRLLRVTWALTKNPKFIISICTNYDLNDAPWPHASTFGLAFGM